MTATARSGFVRIPELEALKHQRLLVIEHRAGQVNQALLVDVELHAVLLVDGIALARRLVVELNHVREARTAAALDAQPHRGIGCAALAELVACELGRRRSDVEQALAGWS